MNSIFNIIHETLKEHIVLKGYSEIDHIYDWETGPRIKAQLEDMGIKSSVFIYPIPEANSINADYWCSVTWLEEGQLNTIGFNWISAKNESNLKEFNQIGGLAYAQKYDNA